MKGFLIPLVLIYVFSLPVIQAASQTDCPFVRHLQESDFGDVAEDASVFQQVMLYTRQSRCAESTAKPL